jgi:uncharacterized protein YgbK (DUF1537 family)
MYSSTVTYRLEMAWVDGDGRSHSLDPTRVAENVPFDSVAPFLAGSEVFRTVPQIDALRAHLRDVARAACGERLAARAEIALDEISDSACALRGDLPSCAAARTLESVACDSSK